VLRQWREDELMATVDSQQHESIAVPPGRSLTGSMLFPDLVWAHWAWQSRVRPHTFVPRGRARRFLARARPNGRASQNGAVLPRSPASPDELARLKQDYDSEAAAFQEAEGEITRSYWCASEASAVVLTEKKKRWSWLPWRRCGYQRLHRATDWVTADAPEIAVLLHSGDMLAIRITRVLYNVPQRIALEWIFSEQSYLLGFVERTGGRPTQKETADVVERHQKEVNRIERYYDRAAKQAARIRYFGGMILGLLFVVTLTPLLAAVIELFDDLDLSEEATRNFYACFAAGAVGAIVSVMTRMRQEDGLRLDYEVGSPIIVLLGAFRPVIGAIFGTATFFTLESGLLDPTPAADTTEFFYYPLLAFATGFSERYAHVVMGDADLTVARALTGADSPEKLAADGATVEPAPSAGSEPERLAGPSTKASRAGAARGSS
jgi:hypothetical protein